LSTKDEKFITILVSGSLYDIFFSDYFFFIGKTNVGNENKIKDQLIEFETLLIRDLVFNLMKMNSYQPHKDNLDEEAYKLLEILGSNSNNSFVISEICLLVLDLFAYNEQYMHQAIHKFRAISIVSHVVKNQQLKVLNFNG
jgi:hypothetical protein